MLHMYKLQGFTVGTGKEGGPRRGTTSNQPSTRYCTVRVRRGTANAHKLKNNKDTLCCFPLWIISWRPHRDLNCDISRYLSQPPPYRL